MYTRAIAINENFTDAYNNRANANKKLGDNIKAIEDLTRGLQVNAPPCIDPAPAHCVPATLPTSTSLTLHGLTHCLVSEHSSGQVSTSYRSTETGLLFQPRRRLLSGNLKIDPSTAVQLTVFPAMTPHGYAGGALLGGYGRLHSDPGDRQQACPSLSHESSLSGPSLHVICNPLTCLLGGWATAL